MNSTPQKIYKLFVDANKDSVALYKENIGNPKWEFLFDLAIEIAASQAELLHSLTIGVKAKYKRLKYQEGDHWSKEEEQGQIILNKYKLNGHNDLMKVCYGSFNQIIRLVNQQQARNMQQRKEALMVLENLIITYLPLLGGWMGYHRLPSIIRIRNSEKTGRFNTVCHFCGKPLLRFNERSYCFRKENRTCSENHLKKRKRKYDRYKKPQAIEQCDVCGVMYPGYLGKRHMFSRKWMKFCTSACYEKMRKREQRKRSSG